MNFQVLKIRPILAAAALVAVTAIAFGGCGGGGGSTNNGINQGCAGGYGGGGGGGNNNCTGGQPSPTPDAAAQAETLIFTNENPVNVAPYGNVLGYQPGTSVSSPNGSNIINLTAAMPVQFTNREASGPNSQHTASLLGPWSGSFPANGPGSAAQTASPAGTNISTTGFTTGTLNAGQVSQVYNSGGPGMFVLGCFFHYGFGMRTVVIVH